MIRRRTIASLIITAALGAAALTSTPSAGDAHGSSDLPAGKRIANVLVHLSTAVTLPEAIRLGAGLDKNIVGYRFENDGVVGEYFPRGDEPSDFLEQFRTDFGMQPRIVSLVSAVEVATDPQRVGAEVIPETIKVSSSGPSELFSSSREGARWDALKQGRELAESPGRAESTGQTVLSDSVDADLSANATTTLLSWEPTIARFALRNAGTPQQASIYQEYVWSEPGFSPSLRDTNTALEFEINQHNANALLWPGFRPNCIANYREHFWAKNANYTWGVFSPYGFASVGIGAYADTDELFDVCGLQSMAIGISNPGNVNDDGNGFTQLGMWIAADRGSAATDSHVSGVIQAVEKLRCNIWPWNGVVSTGCVGLNTNYVYNGFGPSSYLTLNENREVRAPEKCWLTSRIAQQWDPNAAPSQLYFGSCDDMFAPGN